MFVFSLLVLLPPLEHIQSILQCVTSFLSGYKLFSALYSLFYGHANHCINFSPTWFCLFLYIPVHPCKYEVPGDEASESRAGWSAANSSDHQANPQQQGRCKARPRPGRTSPSGLGSRSAGQNCDRTEDHCYHAAQEGTNVPGLSLNGAPGPIGRHVRRRWRLQVRLIRAIKESTSTGLWHHLHIHKHNQRPAILAKSCCHLECNVSYLGKDCNVVYSCMAFTLRCSLRWFLSMHLWECRLKPTKYSQHLSHIKKDFFFFIQIFSTFITHVNHYV